VRLALASCLALAGCTSTPIEVRDSGVFQPGGRLLVRFKEPEVGKPWSGILLDVTEVDDQDEQELAPGELVELDGVAFFGPDTLTIDYELHQQILAFAFGMESPEQHLDTSLELGLGRVQSELELAAGTSRARETDTWDGFHLAAGLTWAATALVGLEGRVAVIVDLDDVGSEWKTIELGTRLFPRSPFALFAGWRWVDVYQDHEFSSDLDLRASGPALALRITL
jgi:hypothetical protein